jgi:hypothetical protein
MTSSSQNMGVIMSFKHSCGHQGARMHYMTAHFAEQDRPRQQAQKCWTCRNNEFIELNAKANPKLK